MCRRGEEEVERRLCSVKAMQNANANFGRISATPSYQPNGEYAPSTFFPLRFPEEEYLRDSLGRTY